jgi:hypothetical protein
MCVAGRPCRQQSCTAVCRCWLLASVAVVEGCCYGMCCVFRGRSWPRLYSCHGVCATTDSIFLDRHVPHVSVGVLVFRGGALCSSVEDCVVRQLLCPSALSLRSGTPAGWVKKAGRPAAAPQWLNVPDGCADAVVRARNVIYFKTVLGKARNL